MKLTVSNIAWTSEEEADVAGKLQQLGVRYVEIAPTKIWEDPTTVSREEALQYRDWWAERGIKVVAFQSMLFARPDLKLFIDDTMRYEMKEYLKKFILLAEHMGVTRMVFGSPKNRQKGDLTDSEADEIATAFFAEVGDFAAAHNVVMCIEPNAPQYNCDYINTAEAGDKLVRAINSDGIGLHLDTACMALAGDDLADAIVRSQDILSHFHVSSPMLGDVEDREDVPHVKAAQALKDMNYQGYVSIEMRPDTERSNIERVADAVNFTRTVYGT